MEPKPYVLFIHSEHVEMAKEGLYKAGLADKYEVVGNDSVPKGKAILTEYKRLVGDYVPKFESEYFNFWSCLEKTNLWRRY